MAKIARHSTQSRHRASHRRKLRCRRKSASSSLQENCWSRKRKSHRRPSLRNGRPLWLIARLRPSICSKRQLFVSMRTPRDRANRSKTCRTAGSSLRRPRSIHSNSCGWSRAMQSVAHNLRRKDYSNFQWHPRGRMMSCLKFAILFELAPAPVNADTLGRAAC